MKIAILGSGSVALANACFLVSRGHEVSLWSPNAEKRARWRAKGTIVSDGCFSGTHAIKADESLEACLVGASFVIVSAPAFAHGPLIESLGKSLSGGQTVLMVPAGGLSSLALAQKLEARGLQTTIMDLSSSFFVCRRCGDDAVKIYVKKETVDAAAIPAVNGKQYVDVLKNLFDSEIKLKTNILSIALNNHNPIIHVPPFLCNMSRIEKGECWVVWENITSGISNIIMDLDEERMSIVNNFGLSSHRISDYLRESFRADGSTLEIQFRKIAGRLRGPAGPTILHHRFLLEDVPYGLGLLVALARIVDVPTPVAESLIALASSACRCNLAAESAHLDLMGLGDLPREEVVRVCTEGYGYRASIAALPPREQ